MKKIYPNATLSENQRLERLQQFNNCLITVKELAGGSIGVEPVLRLMQFSGIYDTPATEPCSTGAEILGEVEAMGIKLNPSLVALIMKSSLQEVQTAILIYNKAYHNKQKRVDKPEGLFYRILDNQRRQQV
jgi:hypothetical protein